MKNYKIADAHMEFEHFADDIDATTKSMLNKQASIDKFLNSHIELAFFAVYVTPENDLNKMHKKAKYVLEKYLEHIRKNKLVLIKDTKDLKKSGRKIVLHLEGIDYIDRLEILDEFYKMGVRSVSLTHNPSNMYAGGAHTPNIGLSLKGEKIVKYIQKKNIILDFAHLSRKSFFDIARVYNKPILVTHANTNKVSRNLRNLTIDQIKMVKKSNGLVGFNGAKSMLGEFSKEKLEEHLDVFEKYLETTGICVGSDLGGMTGGAPDFMCRVDRLDELAQIVKNKFNNKKELIMYDNLVNICVKLLK